jgi:DNA-binding SARP family transcriptional activator/tetratricopeptide (TPR) repeat protein
MSSSPPVLCLLGPPRWQGDGLLPAQRPAVLLCLLACAGQWLEREPLAEWLWPERGPDAALSNLRTALARAAVLARGVPIERQAHHLRWLPATDLQRLEQQLERGDDAALAEAPATLLQGMDAGLSAAALEWLGFRREGLRARWQAAARRRLREAALDADARVALAGRLLAIDPLDEAAVLALADTQQARGDGAVAHAVLRRYAQQLAAEHAVEPSPAVAQRLAGAASPPVLPPAARADPSFIGRRQEAAFVAAWLADPAGRLLTLLGPGGVGKSRLARHALAGDAGDAGAAWVALEGLDDVDAVPAAIGRALGTELSPLQPPWRALALAVGPRALLLVLDGAEHLGDLAVRLDALLAACPGLRLVVASRHRLGLACEQLLPLQGLPLPDRDETDLDVLAHNDAFALFVERARRLQPALDIAAHAREVVALIHAADGLPLALVLAAGWVRALPLSQLAERLAGSDEDALQQSLHRSWQLLSLEDRHTLALLAALPHPLDAEMAQQVAHAALPKLAALIDRSMLATDDEGRFTMHALAREFARASTEAQQIDHTALAARHMAHVGNRLGSHADFNTGDPRPALAALSSLAAHLAPAWRHAVVTGNLAWLGQHAMTLAAWFEHRGDLREALVLFDGAVAAAGDAAPAALLVALAQVQFRLARLREAEALYRRASRRARLERQPRALVRALLGVALAIGGRGEAGEAPALLQHAQRLARQHGLAFEGGLVLSALARLAKARGDYAEAEKLFEASIDIAGRGPQPNVEGVVLQTNNLANLWAAQGQWERALPMFERALQAARQGGVGVHMALLHMNLARAHAALGAPGRSLAEAELSLETARQRGRPLVMLWALQAAVQALVLLGDLARAQVRLLEALELAELLGLPAERARCVAYYGRLLAARGRPGDGAAAATLWRWAAARPTLPHDEGQEIQALLAAMPDGESGTWQPAGEAGALERAVAAVLAAG